MPPEEDYANHTLEEFERYSTKMLGAETVALIFYQLPEMPWAVLQYAARHLYDEVRHCLMGYEWMRRNNLNPFEAPQYLHDFKWRSQYPPVEQYCMLTLGNEMNAFPYRGRRAAAHQKSGDQLSEQFVRYDIADEAQHVRFGKHWLPELLRSGGETRSEEHFIAEVLKVWETEFKAGKLTSNVESAGGANVEGLSHICRVSLSCAGSNAFALVRLRSALQRKHVFRPSAVQG